MMMMMMVRRVDSGPRDPEKGLLSSGPDDSSRHQSRILQQVARRLIKLE
jgi:hypothetical protein